jgi:hypothetical protein
VVTATDFAPCDRNAFCGRAGALGCDLALEVVPRALYEEAASHCHAVKDVAAGKRSDYWHGKY